MRQPDRIWIGLAEVVPVPGRKVFRKARGAFANAMARARNAREFRRRVAIALEKRDLVLVQLEDIALLPEQSEKSSTPNENIDQLLRELEEQPEGVAFGSFHTWEKDDLSH